MSLGRLLAIGAAAGSGLLCTRAAADAPTVAAGLTAATPVPPAGYTFDLAGRRPSIVDVPAGERGPAS